MKRSNDKPHSQDKRQRVVDFNITHNEESNNVNGSTVIECDQFPLPLAKVETQHYNQMSCTEILNKHNEFLATHNGGDFVVQNCIDKRLYNIKSVHFRDFEIFEGVGHAISTPMSMNYSFKLCLDFDLIDETKNTHSLSHTEVCAFREVLIKCLVSKCGEISEFRNTSWFDQGNMVIMTRQLNIHVYINIEVSIILYNHIVDTLLEHLFPSPSATNSVNINSNLLYNNYYTIDKISSLPLPYSAKSDGESYKLAHPTSTDSINDSFTFGGHQSFYDFDNYIHSTGNETSSMHVLSYEIKPFTSKLKIKTNPSKLHITVPCSPKITIKTKTPEVFTILNKIQLKSLVVAQSSFQLASFIQENRKLSKTVHVPLLLTFPEIEGFEVIQNTTKSLTDYIAERVYGETITATTNTNYGYLIHAIESNEKYSAYLMFILCVNCCSQINDTNQWEIVKCHILDFLYEYIRSLQIKKSIEAMRKYNIMNELMSCFSQNYEELLDYIILQVINSTTEINMEKQLDTICTYISMMGYRNIEEELIAVIKLLLQPMKTYCSEDCFVYNLVNHSYELTKPSLSRCPIVKVVGKHVLEKDKSKEKGLSQKKDHPKKRQPDYLTSACDKITSSLVAMNIRFNEYTHFINTTKGVFYTITGTYLPKTPFLYFNMERNFCTTTPNDSLFMDLQVTNFELVHLYEKGSLFLESYIKNQNKLFYLTQMLPGLLAIDKTTYTDKNSERMWLSIFNRIESDSTNEPFLYYLHPVFRKLEKYTMCVTRMIKALITMQYCESSYFMIRESYQALEFFDGEIPEDDFTTLIIANAAILTLLMGYSLENPIELISDQDLNRHHSQMKTYFDANKCTETGVVLCQRIDEMHEIVGNTFTANYTMNKYRWDHIWDYMFPNSFKPYMSICLFLSEAFHYNEPVLREYMHQHSTIYQPCKVQKRMCIYEGSPRSGKSTLMKIYSEICGDSSTYKTNKDYKDPKSGGVNSIHMKTKYLTVINEISKISNTLLKTMTGDDGTNDDRTLYSTKFPMLSNCSMLLAACNKLPFMSMPDEAILSRLVFFNFSVIAVENLDPIDPNCLITFAKKVTYSQALNYRPLAIYLSNLLYFYHARYKNLDGVIIPNVQSHESQQLLNDFLIQNNWVYKVCDMCKLTRSNKLQLHLSDLTEPAKEALMEYNANFGKNYTYCQFITQFKTLFKMYYEEIMQRYIGIGFSEHSTFKSCDISSSLKVIRSQGKSLSLRQFKFEMINVNRFDAKSVSAYIEQLKNDYDYDPNTHCIKDIELQTV